MKKKEIFILIAATLVIGASIFFMLQLLYPAKNNAPITNEADKIENIPSDIDSALQNYNKVEDLSDYGTPNLNNIGKNDLFSKGSGGYVAKKSTAATIETSQETPTTEDTTSPTDGSLTPEDQTTTE